MPRDLHPRRRDSWDDRIAAPRPHLLRGLDSGSEVDVAAFALDQTLRKYRRQEYLDHAVTEKFRRARGVGITEII